ncbi:competence protein ComZ [Thermus sp. PS18]|uniref:Competence protein ComZ n=1 Tax=Thermus brevis TaxID=2862456 RepID=A0ABS6ZZ77_9DEIN|nr:MULTISPECIES: competence protein ComZ [Thermus]MBW6395368.1 competence protein ComZ [Thermus brevis]UZX14346.1 competence protein ComZ [Thermus sp. PS18]
MRAKGVALVATLALMLIIALLVFGTFFRSQIELWVTRNDTTSVQAFYAAEAGLQKYKAVLFQQYVWREQQINRGGGPGCYTSLVTGIDLYRNGNLLTFQNNQIILAQNENVVDANGNPVGQYTVTLIRDAQDGQLFTLVSNGTSSGAKATVQATFRLSNTGYLEQAIFAGSGQANKWLNGGATIRGGIYIVGDPSNPDQYVIESNGNFSLFNSYNLNNYPGIASRVESAYQQVGDLCASVRVQYGKISVGGSTQIGEPSNKVKGVFVGRGSQDITGQNVNVCQNNKGVCTEAMGPFDLSNPPPFPTLDTKLDSDTCSSYPTWRACLQDKATLRIQRLGNQVYVLQPPNTTLDSSCSAALRSGILNLNTSNVDCTFTRLDGTRGGFRYTYSGGQGVLELYGDVTLEGVDVIFNQPTAYRAISGDAKKATLVVLSESGQGGNIDINGNLLPDSSHGLFPNHVLGLIAEKDVYQRGNKTYVMAPVYAGGTFRIEKDGVLFGSVISNQFCTTSAGNRNNCNAGQTAEVVYIRIPYQNRPVLLPSLKGGKPTFQVLSYERR